MSQSFDQFEELGLLAAALCDGEITSREAARLEEFASRSDEARQYFLHYIQLHGELYWENAASAGQTALSGLQTPASEHPAVTDVPRPVRFPRTVPMVVTAMVSAAAVILVALWLGPNRQDLNQPGGSAAVARLTQTVQAEWADNGPATAPGAELITGKPLELRSGLAEIAFDCGARAILEGPATFEIDTTDRGYLRAGKLTASVPREAAGFAVRTPQTVIVDLGTEFGVLVEPEGPSEVHVFAGTVLVQPEKRPGDSTQTKYRLQAGQAVRVAFPAAGDRPRIEQFAAAGHRFVRSLPTQVLPGGSVANLRRLVARHPNLIHHYTFEGITRAEKSLDRRGDLDLLEVVMQEGRGGGTLDYSAPGVDRTTGAVRPYRAVIEGNTAGVSLQSEGVFHPPDTLTLELLLQFDGMDGGAGQAISCAIATRRDDRDCGFFIAAVDDGQLVHLMDGNAPWVDGGAALIPGDWYYLAGTFRVEAGKTTINTYLANLSDGDRALRRVVKDQVTAGVPAASRLGIGKGFDSAIAHAYPWSGTLDEVAIYDTVLSEKSLEEHLRALVGNSESAGKIGTPSATEQDHR